MNEEALSRYGLINISKLEINNEDYLKYLSSEDFTIKRNLKRYEINFTLVDTLNLTDNDNLKIYPDSKIYVEISLNGKQVSFKSMIGEIEVTIDKGISKKIVKYKISSKELESILANRTIYGNIYMNNNTTIPKINKDIIKKNNEYKMAVNDTPEIQNKILNEYKALIKKKNLIEKNKYTDFKYSFVGDYIEKYIIRYLNEEGIQKGIIDPGASVYDNVFEDFDTISLKELFDQLSEISGYKYWIDKDGKFNFTDGTFSLNNEHNIDNTKDIKIISIKEKNEGYANKVFLRGSEPLQGIDKINKTFYMDGYKVSPELDMAGNIKIIVEDEKEIERKKNENIETTGVYGFRDIIEDLTDVTSACNTAVNKIKTLSKRGLTIEIEYNDLNIEELDIINFYIPEYGLDGRMIVTNIEYKIINNFLKDNNTNTYNALGYTIITLEPTNYKKDEVTISDNNLSDMLSKMDYDLKFLKRRNNHLRHGTPNGSYGISDAILIDYN